MSTTESITMRIGTYHLAADTDFSVPQEYAGAAQTVRVPAGDYPIEVRTMAYAPGYRYVAIPLPGVLTFDYFYNRIGACGSGRAERPMTPHTHVLTPYAYEVEKWAAEGRASLEVPRAEWRTHGV